MTGIVYIGLEIGLHGENLPEMDGELEGKLINAIQLAFPEHFEHSRDITVDFVEFSR
jgi:hypothetical protein